MYASRLLTAVAAAALTVVSLATPAGAATTKTYAALGDSYSSGEGACAPVTTAACGYLHGTATAADECHRSKNAYAVRLKATLPRSWKLLFAACSGATTENVLTSGQNGEPAQITRLTPATNLVTMTLGGNDAGFVSAVGTCVAAHTLFGSSCGGKIQWAISPATLRAQLAAVYAAVHTASPHARLLVLGYPRLFSPTPSATAPCPVAAVDSKALSKAEDALNASIAAAVAHADKVAGKKFATFVNNGAVFKGHELCAGPAATSYLNGLLVGSGGARSESFHPNRVGQALLAARLKKALG
jgi:lysophospholipase L1-like esterase